MFRSQKPEISRRNAALATIVVLASLAMEKSCGSVAPAKAAVTPLVHERADARCESNDLVIVTRLGRHAINTRHIDNSPLCITPTFPPATAQQLDQQDEQWLLRQLEQIPTEPAPPDPQAPLPPGIFYA